MNIEEDSSVYIPPKTRWGDEELNRLRELVKTMTARNAAKEMGRSYSSVRRTMTRYGIKGVPQHLWYQAITEEERAKRNTKIKNNSPRKYGTQEEGKRHRQRLRWMALFEQIVEVLGGKCVVCGETELILLQMDHVENDGAEHRRGMAKGIPYYQEMLRVAQEEPGRLQLLCANDHLRKTRLARGWGWTIVASSVQSQQPDSTEA